MGCTSSEAEYPSSKVIPLSYDIINNFVDQLPLIVIQKLNQKFHQYSNKQAELTIDQFIIMQSSSFKSSNNKQQKQSMRKNQSNNQVAFIDKQQEIAQIILSRLYYYYTDILLNKLKFKNFISKYSIVVKCPEQTLGQIIYFINAGTQTIKAALNLKDYHPIMTILQYNQFVIRNESYFSFKPEAISNQSNTTPIEREQFCKKLQEAGFDYEEYRKKLMIFHREDFPFEEIGRKLVEMEMNDYDVGRSYFIISSAWFEKWSFYYQGAGDFMSSRYKSTKLIKQPKISGRRKITKRKSSAKSIRDLDIDGNMWLHERPVSITFDDIEGEYYGELKENIRTHYEVKVISEQIWEMLKKTMNSESEIKRIASSSSLLELYPKMIYFLKTDGKGVIQDSSFEIIQGSLRTKLGEIASLSHKNTKNDDRNVKKFYFIKNFGEEFWNEETSDKVLGRCSTETRFFVIQVSSKEAKVGFLQKYTRSSRTAENLTYGDKAYSYFPYTKKLMPAIIISIPLPKKFKVHIENYNYRYEIVVNDSQVTVEEQFCSTLSETLRKSIHTFSYKGIKNCGNTCFINAILQCLIATPVFEDYIMQNQFDSKTMPLLYQFSLLGKQLINNQKASPIQLKKTIDMELEIFSGNDQHDAQQFLGFLLQKFSNQLKGKQKKPSSNIIEELFEGVVINNLVCSNCQHESNSKQKINILHLPIPEPEYNTFTIFLFPIYYHKIRKIIFRLHRQATLGQYLNCIEERTSQSSQDFIYAETNPITGKRVRKDFLDPQYLNHKLIDIGVSSNIQIFMYERFRKRLFSELNEQNKEKHSHSMYFDYLDADENKWIYGKYLDKTKKKIEVLELEPPYTTSTIKLQEPLIYNKNIAALGSATQQLVFKKLHMRKYNSALKKMENFGFSLMISYPKAVTYVQLCRIITIGLENYVDKKVRIKQPPYLIRIIDMNKNRCVFCGDTDVQYQKQDIKMCCNPTDQQQNIPLIWLNKQFNYTIYTQWTNFNAYNMEFSSFVQADPVSLAVEKQKLSEKVNVEDCLKILQHSETVEMQCDKCKHGSQRRKQILSHVPNILILHMKQFRVTAQQVLLKLDVNLKWIEYLDIGEFSQNAKGCIYELYAYVRHVGTSSYGHYTCVTRRKHLFENKRIWVNFDDQLSEPVEQEQKNIDSAYLLFFKKVDMPNSTYLKYTQFTSV